MRAQIFLLLFLLIHLSYYSCSNTANDNKEEVVFNIVDSLLSQDPIVIDELETVFFAPKGVVKQLSSSAVVEQLSQHIPELSAVYLDQADSTTLILSRTNDYNALKTSLKTYAAGNFKKGGLDIDQYFIQTEMVNSFKLLLRKPSSQKNESFVIDYAIPTRVFMNRVKAIESSIGTIKRVNNQSNQ